MAAYSMMFMGMSPLGAFLAGMLAERLGAPITICLGGLACIAGSAVFVFRLPKLRAQAAAFIAATSATRK
jgi:hypothetical protein